MWLKTCKYKKRVLLTGFTLVELLVSVFTMVLIFSFGYADFRDFSRRKSLEGAAKTVESDLRLAQQMAISGKKPREPAGNVCTTTNLNGYYFSRVSSSTYRIEADCVGGRVSVKSNNLTTKFPGITLQSFTGILFNVLGAGTDIPAGVPREIRMVVSATGETRIVSVTQSGEIR